MNVSVTELNEKIIIFNLYDSSHSLVNSTSFTDSTRTINWTNLVDDTYYYNVTVNDSANNLNFTDTYLIRLDDTKPIITIVEPQAINYGDNNTIELNFTITDNLVGVDSCWYKVINSTNDLQIDNTTTNCLNTTFSLPGGDIDYTLTLYSNDTLNNINSASVTFGIRTISPVVVLYPVDGTYSNRLTDHYFNFTVETNADSISSCQLWGNWTGTWHLNQTILTPSESINTNFSIINLTEGIFLWNVNCSDNFGTDGWALNNITFTTDITFPLVSNISVTTIAGFQTISFNHNATDTNLNTCKYSIFNSNGTIDGLNNNVSLTCNSVGTSAVVSAYGTYNLTIYAIDLAGNEQSDTLAFITSAVAGGTTGGGGGGAVEKVQVIALVKPIDSETQFTDLQRAIIYKEINEIKRLVFGTFAVALSNEDLVDLKERLQNKGITMSDEEVILWVEQFEQGKIDKVFLDKKYYDNFGLVLATGTYCGDGICQGDGNDLGMQEGPFNCNQDCPGADVDSATLNCLDNDPTTKCIWEDVTYQYGGLFLSMLIMISLWSTVKDPKNPKKQIPLHRYYRVKLKQKSKKWRR